MASEQGNGQIPLRREFEQAWHGFDRAEVREYLDHVEQQLRRTMSDRDAAMAQASTMSRELENARREIGHLRSRVDELMHPPKRIEDLDERMQRAAHVANTRAEEIVNRAQVAAEEHWANTTEVAGKLRERYRSLLAELESHAETLNAEHKTALENTKADVQRVTAEANQRQEQLDADTERKRRDIEREFDESMATQRSALETDVADERAASKQEAEQRVAEATDEAKRRVAEATTEANRRLDEATTEAERRTTEAEQKVNRLAEIRENARARLREADGVLARSESDLTPLDDEDSVDTSRAEQADEPPSSATAMEGTDTEQATEPTARPPRPTANTTS